MVAGAVGAGAGGGAGRAGFAPISDAKSTATPLRVTVSAKLCRDAAGPRCQPRRSAGPFGRWASPTVKPPRGQPTVLLPADCPIASRLSYCQPTVVLPADCRIASGLSYCQRTVVLPADPLVPEAPTLARLQKTRRGRAGRGGAGRGGAGRGGGAPSTRRRTWRSYPARTAAPAAPTANQSTEANDLITCTVGTWVGATVGRGGRGEITRQTSEPAVHFSKKCSGRHQPASRPVCGRAAAPSGCGGGRAGHKAGPPRP